jgi:hypothetical protein
MTGIFAEWQPRYAEHGVGFLEIVGADIGAKEKAANGHRSIARVTKAGVAALVLRWAKRSDRRRHDAAADGSMNARLVLLDMRQRSIAGNLYTVMAVMADHQLRGISACCDHCCSSAGWHLCL